MEKSKDTISIIVPIYNVEQYLRQAVDSIRCQTYTNLEIILVDDGSPDNSGAICDEYAKADSRIKVIHKQNGGLSDARNAGIAAASGAYLGFVDSDDFIEPEMFQKLYDALVTHDAQMSVCSFRYVGGLDERNSKIDIRDEVLSGQEILLEKCMSKYAWGWVCAWNKLYRKEMFQELRYPVGKAHEDEFVLHSLLWDVPRVACISYVGYNYVQRSSSIMSTYKVNRLDGVEARIHRADFFEAKGVPASVQYKNLIRGYYVLYDIYANADVKHEPFKSRIREHLYELKKRNKHLRRQPLSVAQKIRLAANSVSPYYTWRLMQLAKKCIRRSDSAYSG